ALGGGGPQGIWREGRNPPIGRVDNPRRAPPDVFYRREYGEVVGAGKVAIGGAPVKQRRSRLLQLFPLRRGKEFLVRIPGGTLQRRIKFLRPDSLKVWFAPVRLQRPAGWRRRRRLRQCRCCRPNDGRGDGGRYDRR